MKSWFSGTGGLFMFILMTSNSHLIYNMRCILDDSTYTWVLWYFNYFC